MTPTPILPPLPDGMVSMPPGFGGLNFYTAEEMSAYAALAYAAGAAAERERCISAVLIELDCNGQAGAIVAAIRDLNGAA